MARQGDSWKKVLDKAVTTATDVLRSQKELLKQRIEEQLVTEKERGAFEKDMAGRRAKLVLQGQQQQQAIKAEYQKLEDEKEAMQGVYKFQSSRVKLDVGGQRFTTSLRKYPGSTRWPLCLVRHKLIPDEEGVYFIDRDGTHFRHVLNFLRDEDSSTLPDDQYTLKELVKEAEFYQIGSLSEAIRSMLVPPRPKMSQHEMNSRLVLRPYRKRQYADGSRVSFTTQNQTRENPVISDMDLSSLSFTGIYFAFPCSFKGRT